MKKSIFQIIIIIILLIGMTTSVLIINKNTSKTDNLTYYPEINDNETEDFVQIDLSGYTRLDMDNKTFPIFPYHIETETYYDNNLSYEEILLDTVSVSIGQKIVPNMILGKKNNLDVLSKQNCIVVEVVETGIRVKNLSAMFASFNYNIYNKVTYQVGDEFDVYKNGLKQATATIISIDYLNIIDDCVKVVVKLKDEDMLFISTTKIELIPKGYEQRSGLSLRSSDLGVFDLSYQNTNKYFNLLFVKDSEIITVEAFIGISYWGNSEVVSITHNGVEVDIAGGNLYAKIAN